MVVETRSSSVIAARESAFSSSPSMYARYASASGSWLYCAQSWSARMSVIVLGLPARETSPSHMSPHCWAMYGASIPPRLCPMMNTFPYPIPFSILTAATASSTTSSSTV